MQEVESACYNYKNQSYSNWQDGFDVRMQSGYVGTKDTFGFHDIAIERRKNSCTSLIHYLKAGSSLPNLQRLLDSSVH